MNERHYLIGTAGHVDHGKTELIHALSGIETDRLKEEKQRGISIELGFAHMKLPSSREVGIVDVPGHERFVRQMLAGASGMDVVLLVIAADEGIMPQTQEHIDILSLLEIPRGIIVLSKVDLVDQEWLELMEEEIKEKLEGTVFHEAEIYRVSALTGEGIPRLCQAIDELLASVDSKKVSGPVRMPLDRVFTIQGHGTVVTGTLKGGKVKVGQELVIEPDHIITKVRSLQIHKHKVDFAEAGQRVAMNLTGVEVNEIEQGSELVSQNTFKVGKILDLKIKNLDTTEKSLTQRQRVRFHLGTAEVLGRLHLLEQEEIKPGQEGFAQILLEKPLVAAAGDRFVIRFYSPSYTIAGGKVLGVAEYKQKRFRESVLDLLRIKDQGDPLELMEQEIAEPRTIYELEARLNISPSDLEETLHTLEKLERAEIWKEDEVSLYWAKNMAEDWCQKLIEIVKNYEELNPLRGGISREELKIRLGVTWTHRRWQMVLELGSVRGYYRLIGSKVQTNKGAVIPPALQDQLNCLRALWKSVDLMPPELGSVLEKCRISKDNAQEYAGYLCDQGEWQNISGYFYQMEDIQKAEAKLVEFLKLNGEVSVAEVRELWGTTRKYAVPLIEFFDQKRITRRLGDKRTLY